MTTPTLVTVDTFLGPAGGEMALAFAAGCLAGYTFFMRTLYKVLKEQKDKDDGDCAKRIEKLEGENAELERRIAVLEDRLYNGMSRQQAQMRDSGFEILGRDKLVRGQEDDEL